MADEIRRHKKPATPLRIAGLRDTEQLEKLTAAAKKCEHSETAEKSGGGLGDRGDGALDCKTSRGAIVLQSPCASGSLSIGAEYAERDRAGNRIECRAKGQRLVTNVGIIRDTHGRSNYSAKTIEAGTNLEIPNAGARAPFGEIDRGEIHLETRCHGDRNLIVIVRIEKAGGPTAGIHRVRRS